MRVNTYVAGDISILGDRFCATVAVDRENITIWPVPLIRTIVRFHSFWSRQAEGSLPCGRELMYTHTQMQCIKLFRWSRGKGKLIQTPCPETQFASAVFSVCAPLTNTALIYNFCWILTLLFLLKWCISSPLVLTLALTLFLCLSCLM